MNNEQSLIYNSLIKINLKLINFQRLKTSVTKNTKKEKKRKINQVNPVYGIASFI